MEKIITFVKNELEKDYSGHNFQHIERVVQNAKTILQKEGGNTKIVLTASYLHDCVDEKLFVDTSFQWEKIEQLLELLSYSKEEINQVQEIITSISYHQGNQKELKTLEAKIVRDADRLDALGAIGIIRTIEYGNHKKRLFYEESNLEKKNGKIQFKSSTNTTLSHFYDKLLKLEKLMHTKTAKTIAHRRTLFLKKFLNEFYDEIV